MFLEGAKHLVLRLSVIFDYYENPGFCPGFLFGKKILYWDYLLRGKKTQFDIVILAGPKWRPLSIQGASKNALARSGLRTY